MGGSEVISDRCPPLVIYEDAFRREAALQIEQLDRDSAVVLMLEDYEGLRAFAKSCIQHGA